MPRSPAASPKLLHDGTVVVVEGRVEARVPASEPPSRGTGAADHLGSAHGLGDLTDDRTHCACGTGNEDDVPGFELGHLEQSGVCRQTRHAKRSTRNADVGARPLEPASRLPHPPPSIRASRAGARRRHPPCVPRNGTRSPHPPHRRRAPRRAGKVPNRTSCRSSAARRRDRPT